MPKTTPQETEPQQTSGQATVQTVLAALCDPMRRSALAIVWTGGEHCVCELMAHVGATQSRMSRHMKTLREAGLVLDRRDAQWVRYRRDTDLSPALEAIVKAVLVAETHMTNNDERKAA